MPAAWKIVLLHFLLFIHSCLSAGGQGAGNSTNKIHIKTSGENWMATNEGTLDVGVVEGMKADPNVNNILSAALDYTARTPFPPVATPVLIDREILDHLEEHRDEIYKTLAIPTLLTEKYTSIKKLQPPFFSFTQPSLPEVIPLNDTFFFDGPKSTPDVSLKYNVVCVLFVVTVFGYFVIKIADSLHWMRRKVATIHETTAVIRNI